MMSLLQQCVRDGDTCAADAWRDTVSYLSTLTAAEASTFLSTALSTGSVHSVDSALCVLRAAAPPLLRDCLSVSRTDDTSTLILILILSVYAVCAALVILLMRNQPLSTARTATGSCFAVVGAVGLGLSIAAISARAWRTAFMLLTTKFGSQTCAHGGAGDGDAKQARLGVCGDGELKNQALVYYS